MIYFKLFIYSIIIQLFNYLGLFLNYLFIQLLFIYSIIYLFIQLFRIIFKLFIYSIIIQLFNYLGLFLNYLFIQLLFIYSII